MFYLKLYDSQPARGCRNLPMPWVPINRAYDLVFHTIDLMGPWFMDHASRHATSKNKMIEIYFTSFSLLMDRGEESNTIQVSCKTDNISNGPFDIVGKNKPTKPNAILKRVFKQKVRKLNWIGVSVICDSGEVTPFNIIQHKLESHIKQ